LPPDYTTYYKHGTVTDGTLHPPSDRVALVYHSFVHSENNHARWLGRNDKLTRIKFEGGLHRVLRVRMDWTQLNELWNLLDHRRTGDIDEGEFRDFFGDLSEFEEAEGTDALTALHGTPAMQQLTQCLFDLCDSLRHSGFTMKDIFDSFDRDASGSISVSEFCSLLRLVVGSGFDKRVIFRAINVLDVDGDKKISFVELQLFVYRIWRSQIDQLVEELRAAAAEWEGRGGVEGQGGRGGGGGGGGREKGRGGESSGPRVARLVGERDEIKAALKRNFTRQYRDSVERG
jgi:Ca2+-binding EF-hand superfamily protein